MNAPGLLFTLPFAGLLLSIAFLPLVAPAFWARRHEPVACAWMLAFVIPGCIAFGAAHVVESVLHALLVEYVPFLAIVVALYVIAGEIRIAGRIAGTPVGNTLLLAFGAVLASFMGTTGASMLLIRPLLRANTQRKARAHQVVFLIFLVANVGGALTPLGDPPLFLGFLRGVRFLWTLEHLWPATVFLALALLAVFYCVDRWFWKRDGRPLNATGRGMLRLEGGWNLLLLAVAVGVVLASGILKDHTLFRDPAELDAHAHSVASAAEALRAAESDLVAGGRLDALLRARAQLSEARAAGEEAAQRGFLLSGVKVTFLQLARDLLLFALAFLSLRMTPAQRRHATGFSWGPVREVAVLFAAIFVTMAPVIAMLRAGVDGPLAQLVLGVVNEDGSPVPLSYYFATGALSSFLDNAPTYLIFFNTAGGEAAVLMHDVRALAAISAGAVFFGAMTYIGNAPNFMVRSIAEEEHVVMPSFFGYMLRWSVPVLLPLLVLAGWIFIA